MFFTPEDWDEYEMEMERFREDYDDLLRRMVDKGLELHNELPDERIEVELSVFNAINIIKKQTNTRIEVLVNIHKKIGFVGTELEILNKFSNEHLILMLEKGVKLKQEFNENSLNKIAKDLENIDDINNERKLQLCDWKKEDYHSLMHIAVLINDEDWFNELSVKFNEVI